MASKLKEQRELNYALRLSEEENQIKLAIDLSKKENNKKKSKLSKSIKKEKEKEEEEEEEKFDEEFGICPITQEYMKNPVLTPSGNYYEKSAIIDWLKTHNNDPLSREFLSVDMLVEDHDFKQKIIEYRRKFNK